MTEMGAHLHSQKLVALAVFVSYLKTAYVRSVRFHEENVGSICATQQDFLLDSGQYKTVTAPVTLGNFCTFLSSVGVKQIMGTIMKIQQNDGWHCMLQFLRDSQAETVMPCLLTPSKNPDLKDVPSLEWDLKVVEKVTANSWSFGVDGKNTTITHTGSDLQPSSYLSLHNQSGPTLLEQSNGGISGSVTPERMACQPFDIWQNWGSELELASPKASLTRPSLSDPGHNVASIWNPTMMLDLNLDLRDFPAHDNDPDCSLLLTTRASDQLDLETPSLSLQQSSVTDDSTDFCALESFADSPSNNKNLDVFPNSRLAKFSAMQNARCLCCEDNVGCHGNVINVPSSNVNVNSSTTSSALYSGHDENKYGSMNSELIGSSPITSRNVCSTGYYKCDVKGHGKRNTRAGNRGILQTTRLLGRNVDIVKSKPPSIRPGATRERITDITLHEISQYFSMPINQAAKKLNVGLTVFKKRCRELKIPRWPHRKMKSINCLIGNIQDLAEEQGVKSSLRVRNVVKELEEQRRLMEEKPGAELGERTKKLRQACFKANYKKRRLGMMSKNNVHCLSTYTPDGHCSPVLHPFGNLELNPTFTDSPPQSCLSMDHFL